MTGAAWCEPGSGWSGPEQADDGIAVAKPVGTSQGEIRQQREPLGLCQNPSQLASLRIAQIQWTEDPQLDFAARISHMRRQVTFPSRRDDGRRLVQSVQESSLTLFRTQERSGPERDRTPGAPHPLLPRRRERLVGLGALPRLPLQASSTRRDRAPRDRTRSPRAAAPARVPAWSAAGRASAARPAGRVTVDRPGSYHRRTGPLFVDPVVRPSVV